LAVDRVPAQRSGVERARGPATGTPERATSAFEACSESVLLVVAVICSLSPGARCGPPRPGPGRAPAARRPSPAPLLALVRPRRTRRRSHPGAPDVAGLPKGAAGPAGAGGSSHADRRSPRLPAAPSADRTIPGAGARPTPRHRAARGRRPRLAREGWLLAARPWSGASTRRPPRRRPRKSTRANFLSLGADVLEGSRRGLAELDRLALRESSAELIAIDLALHR